MALLGSLMDLTSGITLAGVTTTTVHHGLVANPNAVLPIMRSMSAASSNAAVVGIGANASIATVQNVPPSANSGANQTVQFDLLAWKFHSIIQ